jgi:curved DNA-binding protein CbpA
VAGIFSRFSRGAKPLTLTQKHHMMLEAVELYDADKTRAEVEATLRAQGASADEAASVAEQAQAKFEDQLLRTVTLPASASQDVNYYFLLGVTPRASVERIRWSYRRKAKEIHPDRHNLEFTREYWSQLMKLIGEAHEVLTDHDRRRAYDVVWRARSDKVAAENRRKGDLSGDWETRYRWEMAELSELEDEIAELLEEIKSAAAAGTPTGDARSRLATALDNYEAEILELRAQTHSLPPQLLRFGDTVRYEMQRKEHLISGTQQLIAWLPQALGPGAAEEATKRIAAVEQVMQEVRAAQNQFDLSGLR